MVTGQVRDDDAGLGDDKDNNRSNEEEGVNY